MPDNASPKAQAVQIGTVLVAVGLFFTPWLFAFAEHGIATGSVWTLSALLLVVGTANSVGHANWTPLALLVLGLWALIAPAVLGFGFDIPAAFRTHILAALLAWVGAMATFGDRGWGNYLPS